MGETIRSIDMAQYTTVELSIEILRALRDTLDELGDWTLYDEGEWQEYTKPDGVNYVPGRDLFEDQEDYWAAQDATREYILTLEDRLTRFFSIYCGADSDSGMYFIVREDEQA